MLNQVHTGSAPGFLKLLFLFVGMCVNVCLCLPLRALITSGVIWCDVDHV